MKKIKFEETKSESWKKEKERRKKERTIARKAAVREAEKIAFMEAAKEALQGGATLQEAEKLGEKAVKETIKNKDDEYIKAVSEFTNGFSFLGQFPESAGQRVTSANKFKDKEFAERYFKLRTYLQNQREDEFITIQKILKSGKMDGKKIDEATRMILEKRLEKMRDVKKGELYNSYSR